MVTPGPRGSLVLGHLSAYKKDPLGFFLGAALEFPDIARFRMAHMPLFLVVRPEYIAHVLTDNARNYLKGPSYDSLKLLLGEGLLTAEGELWRRQRRLAQPAFLRQSLAKKVGTMTGAIARLVERWRARPPGAFDLVPEMMHLAFDIVGETLMGAAIADEMAAVEPAMVGAAEHIYRRMQAPIKLPPGLPTAGNRRFRGWVRVLDELVARVIAGHRQQPLDNHRRPASEEPGEGDLLSALMAARDEETGAGMDDRQLRDEVITFLTAGHETTGDALAWTFWLLGRDAAVERRLHDEVDLVLDGRRPGADDLPNLGYTGQVIDESMRLYPPAYAFTRTAVERDQIDGHEVPRGAFIVISPWVNHRHPRFWREPERFDPERFAPASVEAIPQYAYFPFGGGPHKCIGQHLSLLELKLAVAMIAQRFRLRLVDGQAVRPDPGIALRPAPAVMVELESR
jgi:cytochrome P450